MDCTGSKRSINNLFSECSNRYSAESKLEANAAEWQKLKGEMTLYMTNDMGRNGYYDQKPIAELIGEWRARVIDPECVLAVGDIHHFNGVASPQDPLWLTNYEYVYSHPDLMLMVPGLWKP